MAGVAPGWRTLRRVRSDARRASGSRLPIINRDKRLVGIISLGDLAVQTGDQELSGEVLEEVSEPARPRR